MSDEAYEIFISKQGYFANLVRGYFNKMNYQEMKALKEDFEAMNEADAMAEDIADDEA
jgi:hypothetical protein